MTESGPVNPYALDPKDPSILAKILALYHKRIVGESGNILALFQACVGASTSRPFIIVIKGQSSAGKSQLAKTVLAPFVKLGIVETRSRITPTYLENMANRDRPRKPAKSNENYQQLYEEWLEESKKPRKLDLTGKILFIDELRGASQALQSIKLSYSEGRIILGTVGENREPLELELTGLRVIITTTTSPSFEDPELENRILPVQIDESESQTERIIHRQAEEGEGLEEEEDQDLAWLESREVQAIADLLNELRPVTVAIPYMKELSKHYPKRHVTARREFPKLKRLIRNIAHIHQYQRPQIRDKKGLTAGIVADPVDLEYVKWAGLGSLRESLTGISPKEHEIRETVIKLLDTPGNETGVTVRQITQDLGLGRKRDDWVRIRLKRMKEDNYIDEDDSKKPYRYKVTELLPETLEIRLEENYTGTALEAWATVQGNEIISKPISQPIFIDPLGSEPPEIDNTRSQIPVETGLSLANAGESCGEPGSQQASPAIGDSRHDLTGNKDLVLSGSDGEELAIVKRAVKEECERIGYAHMTKIRYRVREKIPDPDQVTRIMARMVQNGEISTWGADCFKVSTHVRT